MVPFKCCRPVVSGLLRLSRRQTGRPPDACVGSTLRHRHHLCFAGDTHQTRRNWKAFVSSFRTCCWHSFGPASDMHWCFVSFRSQDSKPPQRLAATYLTSYHSSKAAQVALNKLQRSDEDLNRYKSGNGESSRRRHQRGLCLNVLYLDGGKDFLLWCSACVRYWQAPKNATIARTIQASVRRMRPMR